MNSLQVITVLLVAVISSVNAGLKDQTYEWTDLSAGVAGTIAICFAIVGVGYALYEFNMRNYFRERRNNGTPYTEMIEDDAAGGHYDTVADGAVGGSKNVEMTISGPLDDSMVVNGNFSGQEVKVVQ